MAATTPRRRAPAGHDVPFGPPSRRQERDYMRRADADQAAPYREAYEAGRREGRQETRARARTSSSRRRPVPGARSARAAARQLQAPVRAQVTSGLRIAGVTVALAALYNLLVPPGPAAFSGVLGGVSRALTWLSAPRPFPTRS